MADISEDYICFTCKKPNVTSWTCEICERARLSVEVCSAHCMRAHTGATGGTGRSCGYSKPKPSGWPLRHAVVALGCRFASFEDKIKTAVQP